MDNWGIRHNSNTHQSNKREKRSLLRAEFFVEVGSGKTLRSEERIRNQ
jgi:hypothetical protein